MKIRKIKTTKKTRGQSYTSILKTYKNTGIIEPNLTQKNEKQLYDFIDRECEVLWKQICHAKWGNGFTESLIDMKYYPNATKSEPVQVHHIISRRSNRFRWDINNGIPIPRSIHYHLTNIDPKRFDAWLQEAHPKRHKWYQDNLTLSYGYNPKKSIHELLETKKQLEELYPQYISR